MEVRVLSSGMSVSAVYLEATVTMAAVAREVGVDALNREITYSDIPPDEWERAEKGGTAMSTLSRAAINPYA